MTRRSTVSGLSKAQKSLAAVVVRVAQGVQVELDASGKRILADARKTVPVDTGATRDSGFVQDAPRGIGVELGYQTFYAGIIHAIHRTRAGWLRAAADRERSILARVAAAGVGKRLKK